VFRKAVIVGVDDSAESLRAAAVGLRIAEAAKARLRIVCAVPGEQAVSQEVRRRLVTDLRRAVPAARIGSVDVVAGRAAHVLAARAARSRAGLVVLGGKRHGRLARALGGSTAHYLARMLDIPVLVTAGRSIRRVLIAVDLSAAGRRTLAAGIAFARLLGARRRILHVVEPIRYAYVVPRAPDVAAFLARSRAALDRLVASHGITTEEISLRPGVPAEAIGAEIARWKADLVVVGSHGKGFVDRALIGSTTEFLLNRLTASLLIVPVAGGMARRSRRAR
jgi:nucleotide-binding universal stress UspA family protein